MTEQESLARGTDFRENSWKAFVFVLQFLRPRLRRLLLVCLIDVSIVLLNLAMPWFGKYLVDQVFPQRDWSTFGLIVACVAGTLAVVHILVATRTFLYNTTEQLLQHDLRRKMYGHLRQLSLDTIESLPVGQQQFRVSTDADRIAHMLVRILPTLTMLVEFAIVLAATVTVDPALTVIALAFIIPWTILFVWVTHYGRVLDRRRLRCCELRDAGILQATSSFATIRSMGRTKFELRRNGKVSIAVQRVAAQGYLILVFFEFATQKLLPYLKTTTLYLILARKVVLGQMTLGTTVPMIAYLSRLTFPIERIVNFACWIWQTMVSAERMMQVLETEPAIKDCLGAEKLGAFSGHVKLEKVSFTRSGVGRVLQDVDLELLPGRTVAIVGPSGAGKSTLMSMVLRLLDPSEGTVLVDGKNLKNLDRSSYLHQVGTVIQHTFIFGGSIADNLRIGNPDASGDQMMLALQQVDLGEWVASLPDGMNEDLEGGLGLSAGQRQRIGIARALLSNAPLMLLDEPTSALDAGTEREIMATIRRVSTDKAVLLVTHRLETVRYADLIVVLDQGAVVERGTHEQLLAKPQLYAKLLKVYQDGSPDPSNESMVNATR